MRHRFVSMRVSSTRHPPGHGAGRGRARDSCHVADVHGADELPRVAVVCGSVITADQGRGGVVVLARAAYPPALLHHVFAEDQVGDLVLVGAAWVDRYAV